MDLVELRALVAEGESERLDFKKTTGELKSGLQTICAFLNGSGGSVLFGVTDAGCNSWSRHLRHDVARGRHRSSSPGPSGYPRFDEGPS